MKTKKIRQIRQGDVLLEYVECAPKTETAPAADTILAYGEATGHAHEILPSTAAKLFRPATEEAYVVIRSACSLVHQEHLPAQLTRGTARVIRQREYAPEEIRNVAD